MWATPRLWRSAPLIQQENWPFLPYTVGLTHFPDPDYTEEEVLLCLYLSTAIEDYCLFYVPYLSIYFHCLPLDTRPTGDLNLNLSSPALTDCKTELDCLMTKESSSCEHKTPTVYCSVKHWPERHPHTHTHTHTDVWFHLQSRTLVVSLLWLITEGFRNMRSFVSMGKNAILWQRRHAGHFEK